MAEVPRELKITTRVLLMSSPFDTCDTANPTFLHGLSGRIMFNLFDMLTYASTTQENYVLLSCLSSIVF